MFLATCGSLDQSGEHQRDVSCHMCAPKTQTSPVNITALNMILKPGESRSEAITSQTEAFRVNSRSCEILSQQEGAEVECVFLLCPFGAPSWCCGCQELQYVNCTVMSST